MTNQIEERPEYSITDLTKYFLTLGTTGFGGPVALVGAVIVIAIRSIIDIPTALIAISAAGLLIYVKKVQELHIIGIAAVVGLIIKTYVLQ
jgi:chromate transport protein ChrA